MPLNECNVRTSLRTNKSLTHKHSNSKELSIRSLNFLPSVLGPWVIPSSTNARCIEHCSFPVASPQYERPAEVSFVYRRGLDSLSLTGSLSVGTWRTTVSPWTNWEEHTRRSVFELTGVALFLGRLVRPTVERPQPVTNPACSRPTCSLLCEQLDSLLVYSG
jgi:hypothetical protein